MNNVECESCVKRKTMYCPNSFKCYVTKDKPCWQNRIMLLEENNQLKEQKKELRSWLEDEKDRLARECSQIYEDSLGKTRLVNEDIFNEVNKILSKLNELEGVNNDK